MKSECIFLTKTVNENNIYTVCCRVDETHTVLKRLLVSSCLLCFLGGEHEHNFLSSCEKLYYLNITF